VMPVKEGCCDWKEFIQGNEREMRPIIKAFREMNERCDRLLKRSICAFTSV